VSHVSPAAGGLGGQGPPLEDVPVLVVPVVPVVEPAPVPVVAPAPVPVVAPAPVPVPPPPVPTTDPPHAAAPARIAAKPKRSTLVLMRGAYALGGRRREVP
jgi:hypothetical protein